MFTDSSQQVAVHFVRELDEYFSLRKTPEELHLPLVFRTISDPFAKQWMLTAYRQFKSYEDFKRAFTELLWDSTRQSEIRCRVYQDRYDYRSRESFSEHYIRYANMANMLSPAMSDQDLLSAMVTHYEPRIQACLISANVKSTQEAIAVFTKLHSLENSSEQYKTTRRDFEHQDQTRRTLRGHLVDSAGNRRPNDSVQVRHVRRGNRDRDHRGIPPRDPRANESEKSFSRSGETVTVQKIREIYNRYIELGHVLGVKSVYLVDQTDLFKIGNLVYGGREIVLNVYSGQFMTGMVS
jgi:hypothetical protein